ncbi:MAG: hypothetical protein O2968_23315 [Acidobacteria bacterium]|nr:hypothetical protein [Acidobacteriota bacterium]
MASGYSKVFVWQVGLAAVVGLVLALIWELPAGESGFFFDLPWGFVVGFAVGLLVIAAIAVLGGLIWAGVGMARGATGGMGGAMSGNMDKLAAASFTTGLADSSDSMKQSAPMMGATWAVVVLVGGLLAAGVIFGMGIDAFAVRLIVLIVLGLGGALLVTGLYTPMANGIATASGGGYSWIESPLNSLQAVWDGIGLKGNEVWVFLGAVAWGVGALMIAGGLGTGGIVVAIVLAAATFVAALAGGYIGIQLRRSMEKPATAPQPTGSSHSSPATRATP